MKTRWYICFIQNNLDPHLYICAYCITFPSTYRYIFLSSGCRPATVLTGFNAALARLCRTASLSLSQHYADHMIGFGNSERFQVLTVSTERCILTKFDHNYLASTRWPICSGQGHVDVYITHRLGKGGGVLS